jgi:hypothetical protein
VGEGGDAPRFVPPLIISYGSGAAPAGVDGAGSGPNPSDRFATISGEMDAKSSAIIAARVGDMDEISGMGGTPRISYFSGGAPSGVVDSWLDSMMKEVLVILRCCLCSVAARTEVFVESSVA